MVEEGAESGAKLDGMTTLSLTMLSVDDLESIEESLFWMAQPGLLTFVDGPLAANPARVGKSSRDDRVAHRSNAYRWW